MVQIHYGQLGDIHGDEAERLFKKLLYDDDDFEDKLTIKRQPQQILVLGRGLEF